MLVFTYQADSTTILPGSSITLVSAVLSRGTGIAGRSVRLGRAGHLMISIRAKSRWPGLLALIDQCGSAVPPSDHASERIDPCGSLTSVQRGTAPSLPRPLLRGRMKSNYAAA